MKTHTRMYWLLLAAIGGVVCAGCPESKKPMPPGPISYSLLPEGDRVLVYAPKGGSWNWYTMRLKGSPTLKLWEPKCEVGSDSPSFSPNGSKIVFTRNTGERGRVVVANRDGSQAKELPIKVKYLGGGPVFIGNREVAFWAAETRNVGGLAGGWSDWDLHLYDLATGSQRRLTSSAWSSPGGMESYNGGKGLAFSALVGSDMVEPVYTLDLPMGRLSRLGPAGQSFSGGPTVDPSGRTIAYIGDQGGRYGYEVCLMNADGTTKRQLTKVGDWLMSPRFTRDGRAILFVRRDDANGTSSLWRVGVDGTGLKRIAPDALFYYLE